jgi:tetratricopeptide (TPR) repeat protein
MRLLFAIVASLTASAVAETPKPEPKPISGSLESFSTLPTDYRILVGQCMERFQARDFVGAIVAADKADAMQPPTVWTINTRAAVAIEQRKFAEGEAYCRTALQQDSQFFPALFNLCEIPFLQGRYSVARTMWEKLLVGYPVRTNTVTRDATPELLMYRIFLCYLLEKDFKNAEIWLDRLPFPSDTAAYFYGHAAWERAHGREDRWEDWIKQAEFIWPAAKRANFTDVLIQLGWIKSDLSGPKGLELGPSVR